MNNAFIVRGLTFVLLGGVGGADAGPVQGLGGEGTCSEFSGIRYVSPFFVFCPHCGGRMKVISFLTEYAVVDRIIRQLELTFAAEKPPPCHVLSEVALMAAEEGGDYE